jgi:hypothetical protein
MTSLSPALAGAYMKILRGTWQNVPEKGRCLPCYLFMDLYVSGSTLTAAGGDPPHPFDELAAGYVVAAPIVTPAVPPAGGWGVVDTYQHCRTITPGVRR